MREWATDDGCMFRSWDLPGGQRLVYGQTRYPSGWQAESWLMDTGIKRGDDLGTTVMLLVARQTMTSNAAPTGRPLNDDVRALLARAEAYEARRDRAQRARAAQRRAA